MGVSCFTRFPLLGVLCFLCWVLAFGIQGYNKGKCHCRVVHAICFFLMQVAQCGHHCNTQQLILSPQNKLLGLQLTSLQMFLV